MVNPRIKEFLIGLGMSIILITGAITLPGCLVDKKVTINDPCKNVPRYWYGQVGEDPSKNQLWECYGWEMYAR